MQARTVFTLVGAAPLPQLARLAFLVWFFVSCVGGSNAGKRSIPPGGDEDDAGTAVNKPPSSGAAGNGSPGPANSGLQDGAATQGRDGSFASSPDTGQTQIPIGTSDGGRDNGRDSGGVPVGPAPIDKVPAPNIGASTWDARMKAAASPAAWVRRKAQIRTQILVSNGLWPEFERPPLKPEIFGHVDRAGYSIDKVRFETWPGFYLTGNVYRPLGKAGPFPGIASPHGHWDEGRFQDDMLVSVPGRAITLARMGFVVFSYDMIGYGDLLQVAHAAIGDPVWGFGLMGLQLWNSLRAVDFLVGLPGVDPTRIGATGASGGGTQTFLLTAVDDRVACAVPVNMVTEGFQGGDTCENAPGLRVDLNNAEIASAAAPRPLLLVTATGDWTKNTPTVVGPVMKQLYTGLGAADRFKVVQFPFVHNYNQTSREAMYAWFASCLQGAPVAEKIAEPAFMVEPRALLAVASGSTPPANQTDLPGLVKVLQAAAITQLKGLEPSDAASLARFAGLMRPALQYLFMAAWPSALAPASAANAVPSTLVAAVSAAEAAPLVQALKAAGVTAETVILAAHTRAALPEYTAAVNNFTNQPNVTKYPDTYYRTTLAWQVQDIASAAAKLLARADVREVRLVGVGAAGLPTLFARSLTASSDAARLGVTVVDLAGLDGAVAASWTGTRAQPGILRVGGVQTAAILAAPGRLILHGTLGKFAAPAVTRAFAAAGGTAALRIESAKLADADIVAALAE